MDVESSVEVALVSICVQPPFSLCLIYDVASYVIYKWSLFFHREFSPLKSEICILI